MAESNRRLRPEDSHGGLDTPVTDFAADRAIGFPDLCPRLRSGCRSGTGVSPGEDPDVRRIRALNLALVSWSVDPGVYGMICQTGCLSRFLWRMRRCISRGRESDPFARPQNRKAARQGAYLRGAPGSAAGAGTEPVAAPRDLLSSFS